VLIKRHTDDTVQERHTLFFQRRQHDVNRVLSQDLPVFLLIDPFFSGHHRGDAKPLSLRDIGAQEFLVGDGDHVGIDMLGSIPDATARST
jgi:hypothetical protein